jgi:hypothetical protein
MCEKLLLYIHFFNDYSLLDVETKYKPEAAAVVAPVVPKPVKTSVIKESPTTTMETGKYKVKSGMLTQNYS